VTASRGIRVRALTAAQQDEIRSLRAQGMSLKDISDATGIPKSTVQRTVTAPDPRDAWDLDRQPYGPAEHRLAKQALGLERVADTFVLTEDADPFYSGTAAHLERARWYGQLWRDLGMPDGGHTRRVHYRAEAVGALKPDGTVYRNTNADWRYLVKASLPARYLDHLDAEAVADKRSRGVSVNVEPRIEPDGTVPGTVLLDADGDEWDGWQVPQAGLPDLSTLAIPPLTVTGYDYEVADQPVLIEVWCEKSTMDDILVPLCRDLGVNLASEAKGYESVTHIIELLRRAEDYPARRAVVLYISDNDHAGGNMPVQVARQAQFWSAQLGIEAEVYVHPIVLTDEQVREYGLPQAPDTKDRLRTELDALEALHPGELARIVEAEVEAWRDPDLEVALEDTEASAQEQVSLEWEDQAEELSGELAAIRSDAGAIIREYRPVIEQMNRRLAGLGHRLDGLAQRAQQAADADWDLPGRPEPEDPEAPEDILYDSSRHWLDQLQAYRAHRGQPPLDLPEDYAE
jgi:hypothetical protein